MIEVNELQKRRVVGKLEKHLGKLRGKTIALLGLAFKPNTDDLREAPSLVLASRLLAEGAEVRAWDPVADARRLLQGVTFCDSVLDAVSGADAAVIVTEWDELRELAYEDVRQAMSRPLIVDGRNLLDPEQARGAGFAYEGIGRAASPLAALPETEEREHELERLSGSDHPGGREGRAPRRGRGRPSEGARRAGRAAAGRLPGRTARRGGRRRACSSAARPARRQPSRRALGGIGPEIVAVPEPEPLGRGGGHPLRGAARREQGDVFALNGDELVDVDFSRLLALHRERGAAATITVVPLRSPFGVVDLDGRPGDGLPRGAAARPVGQLRHLRPRRGGARALPRARRPRDDHLPRASRARAGCARCGTKASG